jgi:hypothetical protein
MWNVVDEAEALLSAYTHLLVDSLHGVNIYEPTN